MPRLPVATRFGLAAVLLLGASWGAAQTTPPGLRLVAVDAERPEELVALVEIPPGLRPGTAGDLALLEDGRTTARASAMNTFRESGWTLAAVLAIDTSGSVAKILPAITDAAPPFVAALPEQDAVALVTFDDHVHSQAPFGTPREQIVSSLQGLQPHGRRTLLYQALTQSLELLAQHPDARSTRRIIVVSDGADESTEDAKSTDDIIERAAGAQVAIDTIWVGTPIASRRNTLVRLAERTGGLHTDAISPADLGSAVAAGLTAIAAHVDAGVVLTFARNVDQSTTTSTIGVTIPARTMAPSIVAMQIAGSTAPTAATAATPWWLLLLLGLVAVYVLYAVAYALVLWLAPDRIDMFPFRPWPPFGSPVPEAVPDVIPDPPRRPRRGATMVQRQAAVHGVTPNGPVLVLEAIGGPLKGQRITVSHTRFQVGYGTDNDLRIPSDAFLSSTHAVFETANGRWSVRDQDSTNGTFIDGRKLGTGRSHELHSGETLRVGESEFRVRLGEAAASTAPAVQPEPLEPLR